MTELARPSRRSRSGGRNRLGVSSGGAAQLVSHVYTIEIVEPLARSAEQRLKNLGNERDGASGRWVAG